MTSKRQDSINSLTGLGLANAALSPRLQLYQDINEEETDNFQSGIDTDLELDFDYNIDDQFSHFSSNSNNLKFYSEPLSSRSNSNVTSLGLTRSVGVLNLSLETKEPDLKEMKQHQRNLEENKENENKENDDNVSSLKRTVSKTGFNLHSPFTKNSSSLKNWYNSRRSKALDSPAKSQEASLPFAEAKPDPAAFQSSGLISKLNQTISKKLIIPDTPMKKSPLGSRHSHHGLADTPMIEHSSIMSAQHNSTLPTFNDSSLFKSPPIISKIPPSSESSPTSSSNPRSKKRSKIVNNTELTSMLQQVTDDLYGNDQNGSVFSPFPSTSHLETPTKRSLHLSIPTDSQSNLRHTKTFDEQGNQRSINASVLKNPDFHLTTKFSNVSIAGKGQFSTVYQVTFPETGVRYAVKSVRPTKHNFTKRILQEINILSGIQETVTNDNEGREYIVQFITSWSHKGSFYIMTEFCENGNLDLFIQEHIIAKQQRLDDWRVWKIIVELCLALRYIHESCQTVHLDLKPANILITFEGNLKLADFGMAVRLPIQDKSFENEGDREYIAPEIIRDGIYDFRADIFSLGLMIVEIAANVVLPDNGTAWHKLRSGDLSDAGRLSSTEIHSSSLFSSKKNNTNITNITSHDNEIPAWVPRFLLDGVSLERIIRWMIEPDYRDRPSAAELLRTEELEYVELTRKAGAVIQEDDFGPKPEFFC